MDCFYVLAKPILLLVLLLLWTVLRDKADQIQVIN